MPDYISPPPDLKPGLPVWAYLRDSGGESQERSVGQQRAEVEAYCKRHGLVLAHVFTDEARSGGGTDHREAFNAMMDTSEEPTARPAGLLLWNFARFARDLDDSSYYKALLRKRGIVVHSLTDPIPDGPYSRVIETLIDISNQEKLRQTSRDVKRGLAELVKMGYNPGNPPRGYKAEKVELGTRRNGQPRIVSKWVPDPELWDLVKLAWQMRADGRSYADIQRATKGKLYATVNGWPTFFANKSYLGIARSGDVEVQDHHEPAITWEIWEAVQKHRRSAPRLGKPAHPLYHPQRKAHPTLLSGLAYCIECGAAIIHHKGHPSRPWPYYYCGRRDRQKGLKTCNARRIGAAKADRAIVDTILSRILTPAYVEDILDELTTELSRIDTRALDDEITELTARRGSVDTQITNLVDAVETHGIAAALDRLKQREAERGQITLEIKALEAKKQAAQIGIDPAALELILTAWREKFLELKQADNVPALRVHLARFVTKIELGYNRAVIQYSFPIDGNPPHALPIFGGTSLIGWKAVNVEWE